MRSSLLFALLMLASCDTQIQPKFLVIGDSIATNSARALVQEATLRGHVLVMNAHGGTAITNTEGCPETFCQDQTQTYWLPRIQNLMADGESWDCAVVILGTNDGLSVPDPQDILDLDAALGPETNWFLPQAAKGAESRALIEQLIPASRRLDISYTTTDGIHPTDDNEGTEKIADAVLNGCLDF